MSVRTRAIAAIAAATLGALPAAGAGTPSVAAAPPARASLPAIERQVMCVTCKIPLEVAFSPQAERERAFIRELIGRGMNEAQIKRALQAQYGQAVLALPATSGFDLAAYLVPAVAVLALLALAAVLLPRWRRRTTQAGAPQEAAPLSPSQAARLQADIDSFD